MTSESFVSQRLRNSKGYKDVLASIYSEFYDIFNPNCRRVLRLGLREYVKDEMKRSNSAEPINRVDKMTYKNIYQG